MTFIIAEIGVNHNGVYDDARMLINAAKVAGCDAVKFQAFNPDMAGDNHVYRKLLQGYRLSDEMLADLAVRCDDIGIEFMCTPFDEERLEFVMGLGVKRLKISSQSVTNHRLMTAAIDTGLPLIISNGMCTDNQLHVALNQRGDVKDRTTILYCVSRYPAPDKEIDLVEMSRLRLEFDCKVGFSDHSRGMWASIAAVAHEASVIEKHITFDRNAEGPDHACSLEPDELHHWVTQIRVMERRVWQ